jgi:glutamate-ammonia-ligase adenylyltransferase
MYSPSFYFEPVLNTSTNPSQIQLTEPMRRSAELRLQRIADAAAQSGIVLDSRFSLEESLPVLACSEFVTRVCCREPALLMECLSGVPVSPADYRQRIVEVLTDAGDENEVIAGLRQLRNREMARIAWMDLSARLDLDAVLAASSSLAEAFIDCTLEHLHARMCEQWGTPRSSQGLAQQLVVLAMGKLGGRELNFSSDIDLIFTYPERGQTDGGKRLDNAEFFTRLGQRLIKTLNDATADGFVYRVDMRLRPFGDSGPLAASFDAMENYYQVHGREWERYAMIKARVVAGDRSAGAQLLSILRPFVYRRYLDFGAIESLRELKAKIAVEVTRTGMLHNIKLGPGGIREIEFTGQVFQLVRGGQNAALQTRSILDAIDKLVDAGHLNNREADTLLTAYRFLRRLENRLQMCDDEQTHELPGDPEIRAQLARSMGFTLLADFETELERYRTEVEQLFQSVFRVSTNQPPADSSVLASAWEIAEQPGASAENFKVAGFDNPDTAFKRLQTFKSSRFYRNLSTRARTRLDALMPRALAHVVDCDNRDDTLQRLIGLLRAITGRSVYLAMLLETPAALLRLVGLLSASAWVAEFVTRHPLVIDELLDPHPAHPDRAALESAAREAITRLPEHDLGELMDALRQYKQTQLLRVASADLDGAITVMQVSDHLTWLAEALLQVVSDLIWDELVTRYGRPSCVVEGKTVRPGFGIVAYGKLGGNELGYGSDLDIVFLHESEGVQQRTEGANSIDNTVFFARLVQKLVHFIATLTPAGVLYEVDTRLRPNGASGLLVSSIDAFAEYQLKQAWTWEHQALVRAQMVVGSERLRRRFVRTREQILSLERDYAALGRDVVTMRERMYRELSRGNAREFDIKQDRGGVADIEFMVQYLVLAWAHQYPSLTRVTDNYRLLEFFGAQRILSREQADKLAQSYLVLRNRIHRLVLQDASTVVERSEVDAALIDGVVEIWQSIMPAVKTADGD